jgi:hypothetical protein
MSEKKLGMVDKSRTYYEKSSAWANKGNANRTAASGASSFYPQRQSSTQFKQNKADRHFINENRMVHHQGKHNGINGIIQQMNKLTQGFLQADNLGKQRRSQNGHPIE